MIKEQRKPVLFIGHGSPMNAIEDNLFAAAWRDVALTIPRPKAILSVSAHWETDGSMVTAMKSPRTIHDFYGFPQELFHVEYPAPGAPELANHVVGLFKGNDVTADESWGLDHGTWSVLRRMYPEADIPVLQLSLDRQKSPREHVALAQQLLPLRDEGVLIIGSGNIVHNLPLIRWHDNASYPWAAEFNATATEFIRGGDLDRLTDYAALGEAARLSIPTNEHYLPLLYSLALRTTADPVSVFTDEIVLGSISMQSVMIG
ncbi:MAG: 4,5-DOPA dioxygenase extradiol [Desulfuromonadaceae bacterium]|nr:4,5-DOPA dioxygenase extradiol [Desulfuromonadaceae bacterium]